jgi:hypothetical protein
MTTTRFADADTAVEVEPGSFREPHRTKANPCACITTDNQSPTIVQTG